MAEFFNDRQKSARADGDDEREVSRSSLKDANSRIRAVTPVYEKKNVDRKIRTTAVQRHRGKQFGSVSEYMDFILGTNDGC